MTTQEVADRLVELCRTGQYTQAHEELYDNNAASIEPDGYPMGNVTGMDAIKAKGEQWASMVEEVHSASVSDPVVAGDFFSCSMKSDVTFKEQGRMNIEEVAVYEVRNGKVVKEQFFFTPAPSPAQG